MEILIRYYGVLTDVTACESEVIKLSEMATLDELKSEIISRYPSIDEYTVAYFTNNLKLEDRNSISPGMEIDCMPPFSGG
ncbi:MAG: MoaD/ThiS family protein [Bacteroidales bacterium]|jgi:molybdopterin converting factor small subunit